MEVGFKITIESIQTEEIKPSTKFTNESVSVFSTSSDQKHEVDENVQSESEGENESYHIK